ncbi:hypothetical protein QUV00_23250, partial [Xanthomonas citri pv. citri]
MKNSGSKQSRSASQHSAPFASGLAAALVGAEILGAQIGRRQFLDAVDAADQVGPERVGIAGFGELAGQADDRDGHVG